MRGFCAPEVCTSAVEGRRVGRSVVRLGRLGGAMYKQTTGRFVAGLGSARVDWRADERAVMSPARGSPGVDWLMLERLARWSNGPVMASV